MTDWNQALLSAVKDIDQSAVEVALANGAEVDVRSEYHRYTPLMIASERWDPAGTGIIARLLAAGADINAQDIHGRSPLILASSLGPLDTVALLLDEGADINARDGNFRTSLFLASRNRNREIGIMLLEHGFQKWGMDGVGVLLHDALGGNMEELGAIAGAWIKQHNPQSARAVAQYIKAIPQELREYVPYPLHARLIELQKQESTRKTERGRA